MRHASTALSMKEQWPGLHPERSRRWSELRHLRLPVLRPPSHDGDELAGDAIATVVGAVLPDRGEKLALHLRHHRSGEPLDRERDGPAAKHRRQQRRRVAELQRLLLATLPDVDEAGEALQGE